MPADRFDRVTVNSVELTDASVGVGAMRRTSGLGVVLAQATIAEIRTTF
jgi:hypothetical protein